MSNFNADVLPVFDKILHDAEIALSGIMGARVTLTPSLSPGQVDESALRHLVCQSFGVSWLEIQSRTRKTYPVAARHVYCFLSIALFKKTLNDIGSEINRDHTSVIHARERIKKLLDARDAIILDAKDAIIAPRLTALMSITHYAA